MGGGEARGLVAVELPLFFPTHQELEGQVVVRFVATAFIARLHFNRSIEHFLGTPVCDRQLEVDFRVSLLAFGELSC